MRNFILVLMIILGLAILLHYSKGNRHEALASKNTATVANSPAQNIELPSPADVNDVIFDINQKMRYQMHALTNECMVEMSQIPSDVKIRWCHEQKQALLDRQGRLGMHETILAWKKRLAACEDDNCRTQIKNQIYTMQQQDDDQMDQLKADLDNCQYDADQTAAERCREVESIANRSLLRN